MYFTFKDKAQIENEILAGFKARQITKALFYFQNKISNALKHNQKDIDIHLLNALELALELELITTETYRRLEKEATAASKKIDKYWKEQDKLDKDFDKDYKAAKTPEEKEKIMADYRKKSWRYQYENK